MLRNGVSLPGLEHTIILSKHPLTKSYVRYHGTYLDKNIKDVGETIIKMVALCGWSYVSLKRDISIEGRSWEMACAHACVNVEGCYSGTVESLTSGLVRFGDVPGVPIKRMICNNVITSNEKPTLKVFPA
jgi:hypothetical protein